MVDRFALLFGFPFDIVEAVDEFSVGMLERIFDIHFVEASGINDAEE